LRDKTRKKLSRVIGLLLRLILAEQQVVVYMPLSLRKRLRQMGLYKSLVN
jgi:hypothetical protein